MHSFNFIFPFICSEKPLYHNMPNSVILAIFIHGLYIPNNILNKILSLAFTFIDILCFNCNVSYVLLIFFIICVFYS